MRELRTDQLLAARTFSLLSSKLSKYEDNMNILMQFLFISFLFSTRGAKMTDIERKFKLPSYFFKALDEWKNADYRACVKSPFS